MHITLLTQVYVMKPGLFSCVLHYAYTPLFYYKNIKKSNLENDDNIRFINFAITANAFTMKANTWPVTPTIKRSS